MSELFPGKGTPRISVNVQRWTENYAGMIGYVNHTEIASPCARCGSLVLDRDQHTRWHGSVDSNATTGLAK